MEFDLRKCKKQPESNNISRQYYDGVCIFSGELHPDASHIFPIGQTRYVALRKRPIAALPSSRDKHDEYEWEEIIIDGKLTIAKRRQVSRVNWLFDNVLNEYRNKLIMHLSIFFQFCIDSGIPIKNESMERLNNEIYK